MTNVQFADHTGNTRYTSLLLAIMIAAGLAGNVFPFSILNAHFIFGSIFAMLALQMFGFIRGVAAAAIIASYTILAWNHPWAFMTMTLEVVVVGWLLKHHPISLVMADTFYWLFIGIPIWYVGFHVISHFPASNSLFLLPKQAINGMANALIARLLFSVYVFVRRPQAVRIAFRELVSSLLAFFALSVALIMLILDSQADLVDTDRHIRAALIQTNQQVVDSLTVWLEDRKQPVVHLAEIAATLSGEQMQSRLEQTRASDANFLRIALIDKSGVSIAYAPCVDEQGQSTIGRNFGDRPYIPVLKQTLQPMLSEVIVSRFGRPVPIVTMLAPVIASGEYQGAAGGIMNFDRITDMLEIHVADTHIHYTLADRNGHVILTNRPDQIALAPFVRNHGELQPLDDVMSQWIPPLPFNTSTIDLWGQSNYVVESAIGPLSEWRLILEQPVAPFQKTLYNRYSRKFFILFGMLLASFGLAELLSRRVLSATEDLSRLTRDLPLKLASGPKIVWPDSAILEIHNLTGNFRTMAASLTAQFRAIEQMNASLEHEVEQQTADLRASEAQLRETRDYLENLLDYANAPIIVWDAGFRITRFNHAFERLTGYHADDVLGKPLDRLFPIDQRAASLNYINRIATGERWESVEIPILCQNGVIRIVLWNSAAIYAPDGKTIMATIAQGQDITARKQAEDALQESETRFRAAFENASVGMVLTAPDGRLIKFNQAFCNMLGYTARISRESILLNLPTRTI